MSAAYAVTMSCEYEGRMPEAPQAPPNRPETMILPWPEMILGSITDLVEVIDRRGIIIYSNLPPSYQNLLDLERAQGLECRSVYGKLCPSCLSCPLDKVLASDRSLTLESRVESAMGGTAWLCQRLYPIKNRAGQAVAVLRLAFDITLEKRVRAKKAEQMAALEQSRQNLKTGQACAWPQALSVREEEVLVYVAGGLSNPEIARRLNISHHTVKSHVTHIFNKLGVNDRTQAAVAAFKQNLV
jgi:DNA-binding CsgD family transcriptional regulator